jgi:Mrp family chromosome partitioning ATPase
MKKLSFAQDDFADLGLLRTGLAARETEWEVPEDLAVVDLIELFLEIESALDMERGTVVQFIGASGGPGSALIALDMAWAAVSVLGRKVLVLNCTRNRWTMENSHTVPNEEGSIHPISTNGELVKVAGHELYMADMLNWHGKSLSRSKNEEISTHLREFCHSFDMVVVVPPPADSDPLGAILARCVDGSILVIEAEQTRRSAAIRLREILSRSGRPIVGAVLHDRQNHIPPWLASMM